MSIDFFLGRTPMVFKILHSSCIMYSKAIFVCVKNKHVPEKDDKPNPDTIHLPTYNFRILLASM